MNPLLVACLACSTIVGAVVATLAIASGSGLLIGLVLYSTAGSMALVSSTLICSVLPEPSRARMATNAPALA